MKQNLGENVTIQNEQYEALTLGLKSAKVTYLNGRRCCLRRVPGNCIRHMMTTNKGTQFGAHHEQDFVVGLPKAVGHVQ
jgi:hypothetical protein